MTSVIVSSIVTSIPASNLVTGRVEETFIVKSGKESASINMKTFLILKQLKQFSKLCNKLYDRSC